MSELDQIEGWISTEVADEFPELRLVTVELTLPRGSRRSPRALKQRLGALSDRFAGPQAIHLRRAPIPAAYRVFFHHIGLDPDQTRTPIEQAVLERMVRGGFVSHGYFEDALLVALVETGVPVWGLDAESVWGPIGLRTAEQDELLGRRPDSPALEDGRLVVADLETPLAVLFGDIGAGHAVSNRSKRAVLFAVQVGGVPRIHVEEALWQCASTLTGR